MKPIDINLSAQPYRNDTPLWGGMALVVLAALGFTVYNAWHFTTANQRIDSLTAELAGHRQKMESLGKENEELTADLKAVDADLYATQVEFVNDILTQRNFSWTRLFNALEDVVPWDVRLTAIRPVFDGSRVSIQVSGVSRDYEALLKFEEEVGLYPQFDGLTPGDFNRGDAGDQIYFNLSFNYRPDAVEKLAPEGELSTASEAPPAANQNAAPADHLAERGNSRVPIPSRDDRGRQDVSPIGSEAGVVRAEPARQPDPEVAIGGAAGRGEMQRPTQGDPRAERRARRRAGEDVPRPLEEETTFGGEFIPGQAASEPGSAPTARTPRSRDPNSADPQSSVTSPNAAPNRPRRPSVDPSQYVTYDENGKPVLHPYTRENPPPPSGEANPPEKGGGGGQP